MTELERLNKVLIAARRSTLTSHIIDDKGVSLIFDGALKVRISGGKIELVLNIAARDTLLYKKVEAIKKGDKLDVTLN